MKLLFDQNISYRIVKSIEKYFTSSSHVKDFDLINAKDSIIWDFAKENDYAIVSKDTDFLHRSLLFGFPPKIIFLKIGNCSSDFITNIITKNIKTINIFLKNSQESLLIL